MKTSEKIALITYLTGYFGIIAMWIQEAPFGFRAFFGLMGAIGGTIFMFIEDEEKREIGEEKITAIAFHCKKCGGIIYVCVNRVNVLEEEADNIRSFLKKGYNLSSLPIDEVNKQPWCKCEES
jgi:hypothetical protein